MNTAIKILIILATITVGSFWYSAVWAQSDERQPSDAMIQEYCATSQEYIRSELKGRDLRSRVDHLRIYQYIYQRLDVFTVRLEKNQQTSASALRQDLNNLRQLTDDFKLQYELYDSAREELVNLTDCSQKAADFRQRLMTARERLARVESTIAAIDSLIEEKMKANLTVLKAEFIEKESEKETQQ